MLCLRDWARVLCLRLNISGSDQFCLLCIMKTQNLQILYGCRSYIGPDLALNSFALYLTMRVWMTQSLTKPKPMVQGHGQYYRTVSILQSWNLTAHQLSAPGCQEEQPFSPFSGKRHVLPSSVVWGKLWVGAVTSRADGEVVQRGLWVCKGWCRKRRVGWTSGDVDTSPH